MSVYYNEIDPFAAEWLRQLIKAGHIANGTVDERSIEDVAPNDLMGFTQCHFFAGIGVWSYALRLAGWPDDRPVWTGSCPCQPFSSAGKGGGFDDERHLWPAWFHLISVCKPPNIFGEQVASKDGLAWLDLVQSDLEGANYRCGATDICAAGVGAPHIRQRMWIVADSRQEQRGRWPSQQRSTIQSASERIEETIHDQRSGTVSELVNTQGTRHKRFEDLSSTGTLGETLPEAEPQYGLRSPSTVPSVLGNPNDPESARIGEHSRPVLSHEEAEGSRVRRLAGGFWRDADWIWCRDQKYRPVEPGTFPLAHGATNRVGRLRGYGNAISPWAAKEVIEAYMSPENGQGEES